MVVREAGRNNLGLRLLMLRYLKILVVGLVVHLVAVRRLLVVRGPDHRALHLGGTVWILI